jgi:hypothetical protein
MFTNCTLSSPGAHFNQHKNLHKKSSQRSEEENLDKSPFLDKHKSPLKLG